MRWTSAEDEFLRTHYGRLDYKEMAKRIQRTKSAVRQRCRYLGLVKPRTRSVDESFFLSWNPDMAYVLGFIAADGYVSESRKYLRIEIADGNHLVAIGKKLASSYPIRKRIRGTNAIYYSHISSRPLVESLVEKGVRQAKSFSVRLPDVDTDMLWHYLRGYFDGDGCVRMVGNTIRISMVSGSENMVNDIRQFLKHEAIETSSRDLGNKFELNVIGASKRRFYQRLYANAGLYLQRKQRIFAEYFARR